MEIEIETCPECGHQQSGYPEGYCEQLVMVGGRADSVDLCACTNDTHSDHPHEWVNAICLECAEEQSRPLVTATEELSFRPAI